MGGWVIVKCNFYLFIYLFCLSGIEIECQTDFWGEETLRYCFWEEFHKTPRKQWQIGSEFPRQHTRQVEYPFSTTDQPKEMPWVPANLSKDCTDFSLKDLSKPLHPTHDNYNDFSIGTSCLVSNIGHVKLKKHADKQGKLEVTIKRNMLNNQCIHKVPFVRGLEGQKSLKYRSQ